MSEVKSRYSDKAYELAIEKIESMYADTTIEILKNSSFDHLPRDIVEQLNIAQSKIDQLDNPITIPLGHFTLSIDGKTCSECSSELVVKNSTVSDSAGVRQIKKLQCPKSCNKLDKSMKSEKDAYNKVIVDSKNLTKGCTSIYTLNTRGFSDKKAYDILKINMEHGHKVSVINAQFAVIDFGLIPVFETKEKFNKKTGKVIEYIKCEHDLDEYLNTIEESKIYKVLKVERIGNLCSIRQFDDGMQKSCECGEIAWNIKHKIEQCERDGTIKCNDYSGHYKIEQEFNTEVVYFKITVQRVDVEIPKVILKVLSDKRFKIRNLNYFKSYQVTEMVVSELNYLSVPDNLKAKVTSQLKKLSNDCDLEIKYEDWEFSPERHQSSFEHKPNMDNQVSTFYGNHNYIGTEAKKLNHYRISDHYAIYLTKQVQSTLKSIKDDLKDIKSGYSISIDGVAVDPKVRGFELSMLQDCLFEGIAQQVTGDKNMAFSYYPISYQLSISEKSGIIRKRR